MNDFKYGAYILSQYVWIIIYLLVPFLCFILVPHKNNTGEIYSLNSEITPFNKSQIPVVFMHLTDLHINHVINSTIINFNSAAKIINQIKPNFNIITGDLADNFPSDSKPRYGYQIPQDFEMYKNVLRLISDFPRIEMDGNHDLFGVFDYNSKKSVDPKPSFSEYRVSSTSYLIGRKNYTFITMNPFIFPSPHPPFIFYAHPSTEFLDRLEEVLSSIPKENEIIALSHFPMYLWNFGHKSSRKFGFNQIMKSGRIKLFINGHLHPDKPCIQHHKDPNNPNRNGLLEIVGADLRQHHKIAICVIDNERFSYHSIDVTSEQKLAFITNPLPDEILSSHQIFNEKNTFLRVISYQEEKPTILASGDVQGELECNKTDTFWLCQTPMNLEYGKHSITLTGDLKQTIHFTIGDHIPSFKEDVYQFYTSRYIIYYVLLSILYALLAFIIIPFPVHKQFEEKYELWINGVDPENTGMWLLSIFGGFYCVKMRISNLPIVLRVFLLIALIWPLFLPIMWMSIQGHFGFIWLWGFVCDWTFRHGVWAQYLTLTYLTFILLPITLLCSMLYVTSHFHWTIIPELIVQLIAILADIYLFLRFCNEASGMARALLSPSFVFTPLFFYIGLIIWRICSKKGIKDDNNVVITQALLNE